MARSVISIISAFRGGRYNPFKAPLRADRDGLMVLLALVWGKIAVALVLWLLFLPFVVAGHAALISVGLVFTLSAFNHFRMSQLLKVYNAPRNSDYCAVDLLEGLNPAP
jgi:hypothetical protein